MPKVREETRIERDALLRGMQGGGAEDGEEEGRVQAVARWKKRKAAEQMKAEWSRVPPSKPGWYWRVWIGEPRFFSPGAVWLTSEADVRRAHKSPLNDDFTWWWTKPMKTPPLANLADRVPPD